MSLECAHLGLVAGTCSRSQANIGNSFFSTPNNCSVFMSGTGGVRGSMSMLILCVELPVQLLIRDVIGHAVVDELSGICIPDDPPMDL